MLSPCLPAPPPPHWHVHAVAQQNTHLAQQPTKGGYGYCSNAVPPLSHLREPQLVAVAQIVTESGSKSADEGTAPVVGSGKHSRPGDEGEGEFFKDMCVRARADVYLPVNCTALTSVPVCFQRIVFHIPSR